MAQEQLAGTGQLRRIFVAVQTYTTPGSEMLEGIRRFAAKRSWQLYTCFTVDFPLTDQYRTMIRKWRPDGVIVELILLRKTWQRFVKSLSVRTVNVGSSSWSTLPNVRTDDVQIGAMAARHLIEQGFRSMGFVGYPDMPLVRLRMEGFVETLRQAGLACQVYPVQKSWADWNIAADAQRLERWLAALPKPAGIMGCQDNRGGDVVVACERLGLSIPEQVAFIGAGNDLMQCLHGRVELSSVDANSQQVGWQAAQLLEQLMDGKKALSQLVLVPPLCPVVRRSTDAIAVSDRRLAAAIRFIRENAHRPIRVDDVARELAVSRSWLDKQFLVQLGRRPGREITLQHVQRAKQLLSQTDLSMPELSKASGFVRADHFCAVFKRSTGMTPTQYRRQNRLF